MRRYLDGLHAKFGHLAVWPPNDRLKLGDIGVIRDGRFFLRTSLDKLGIRFDQREGERGDLIHSSGEDLAMEFDASAGDAVDGDAGIAGSAALSFGAVGAFIFQAVRCRLAVIEDMTTIGALLLRSDPSKVESGYVVIDRLMTSECTTILIADSHTAHVELKANARFSAASLADPAIGLRVDKWRGEVTRFVAEAALTPMFGASRVLRRLIRKDRVDPLRSDWEHAEADEFAPAPARAATDAADAIADVSQAEYLAELWAGHTSGVSVAPASSET